VAAAPVAQPSTLSSQPAAEGRLKISPLARRIAADQKVDATRLTGSGPHGRIVKADVLAAAANPALLKSALPAAAQAQPQGGVDILPWRTGPIQESRTVNASNMRATIAKRLLEAKTQIPHFYLEIEVDAEPLLAVRTQLNTAFEKDGVKLSVNDFVLKASAEALRRVPGVNASWTGAGIQYHGAVHVSFAVAIEDGLITPVIRDTHTKSLFAISTEAKPLGKRAKEKKLKPDEFTGGTFCVSNLGMMGITKFSAIINPPNAAILAVGTTVTKPVVKHGAIVVGQTMVLTLSCDHRVVDGALGAQFLAAIKDLLEKPALLLV
jgi:pyruvate dehydrogenase E2 component (dihydrolipoamide acetyltransferase)